MEISFTSLLLLLLGVHHDQHLITDIVQLRQQRHMRRQLNPVRPLHMRPQIRIALELLVAQRTPNQDVRRPDVLLQFPQLSEATQTELADVRFPGVHYEERRRGVRLGAERAHEHGFGRGRMIRVVGGQVAEVEAIQGGDTDVNGNHFELFDAMMLVDGRRFDGGTPVGDCEQRDHYEFGWKLVFLSSMDSFCGCRFEAFDFVFSLDGGRFPAGGHILAHLLGGDDAGFLEQLGNGFGNHDVRFVARNS